MTDPLGLESGTVRVVPGDAHWPAAYGLLAERLHSRLGPLADRIEHVGSTSVPGLAAKPILDVAVLLVPDVRDEHVVAALGPAFEFRGDQGGAGGLLFLENSAPDVRSAHIHVVRSGDRQWERYLTVRDRLRSDPAARAAYARLKHALAEQYPQDRGAYTAAKSELIRKLADGTPIG